MDVIKVSWNAFNSLLDSSDKFIGKEMCFWRFVLRHASLLIGQMAWIKRRTNNLEMLWNITTVKIMEIYLKVH